MTPTDQIHASVQQDNSRQANRECGGEFFHKGRLAQYSLTESGQFCFRFVVTLDSRRSF
jgi:hypothetical protein